MSRYSNQKRAKKAASQGSSPATPASDALKDVKLRKEAINSAIVAVDPAAFSEHLAGWLEATAYLRARDQGAAPVAIPDLSAEDFAQQPVRAVADDAVFAFCIAAALASNKDAAEKLETELTGRFGAKFPGAEAAASCLRGAETGAPLEDTVGGMVKDMLDAKAFDPRDTWNAGLRLVEKARMSNFVQELMPLLAKWHRERWQAIITGQLFNLTRPRATVPPIEAALGDAHSDQCFIASLLIAATGAVDLELDETYQAHLKGLAQRG